MSTPSASAPRTSPKSWSPTTRRASSWVGSISRLAGGSTNRMSRRSSKSADSGRSVAVAVAAASAVRVARRDGGQRALRPPAVGQLLAVDGDLGLPGPEPQRQPMPARRAGQVLDLQGRAARRLDAQAVLGPSQDDPDRGRARRAAGRPARRRTRARGPPCRRRRRPARAGRRPAAPPGYGSARRSPRPAAAGPVPARRSRPVGRRRDAGDRPSRRVDRLEPVGQHPRLAGALHDRLDACPGHRHLAGLPGGGESHLGPGQGPGASPRAARPLPASRWNGGRPAGAAGASPPGPLPLPLAADRSRPAPSRSAGRPPAGRSGTPSARPPRSGPRSAGRRVDRAPRRPPGPARRPAAAGTPPGRWQGPGLPARPPGRIVSARFVPFMETDSTPRTARRARRGTELGSLRRVQNMLSRLTRSRVP